MLNFIPAGIYLLKVNKRNTTAKCEICSKLTIKISERRRRRCSHRSCKKSVLKNLANFTGEDLCWSLFSIKLQDRSSHRSVKKCVLKNFANLRGKHLCWTPTQVFSCEIYEIFKNIFLNRTPLLWWLLLFIRNFP